MKKLIITVLIAVIAICTVEAQEKISISNFKQEGISISNFKADNLSDSELLITVDYSYTGDVESKDIFINAFPIMNDGIANFREVSVEQIPIEAGNHQANMKISQKPDGKNFSSESIKICVLAKRHSILCEEFPFAKSWINTENPAKINSFLSSKNQVQTGDSVTLTWETENTSAVMLVNEETQDIQDVRSSGSKNVVIGKTSTYILMAFPKSSNGVTKVEKKKITVRVFNIVPIIETCTISGQLTGKWKQEVIIRTQDPTEIWIVKVFVTSKDSGKVISVASVDKTGRFISKLLPAGKRYILKPQWKSNPREITVSCEKKKNHQGINFNITGRPIVEM